LERLRFQWGLINDGVLAFALTPPFQRFAILTGLAIIVAVVTAVRMPPGLLVARERLLRGGQYRELPLRSMRPPRQDGVVRNHPPRVAGCRCCGLVRGPIAMKLQRVASLTTALFRGAIVGAIATMIPVFCGESIWLRRARERVLVPVSPDQLEERSPRL
jgi:hypothetical protein